MSKSIKIEDDVYQDLDDMRGKRDTFSQVISRLIHAAALAHRAGDLLQEFPPVVRCKTSDLAAPGGGHRVQSDGEGWN